MSAPSAARTASSPHRRCARATVSPTRCFLPTLEPKLLAVSRWSLLLLIAVISALVLAAPASADVLVQAQPKDMGCAQAMRLGAWYQTYSGGPRWFYVSVYRPDGRRVFYRHGLATTTWRIFRYRPIT